MNRLRASFAAKLLLGGLILSLVVIGGVSAIRSVLAGSTCGLVGAASTPGACGIDVLTGGQPSYAVGVPVVAGGSVVGVVAYIAPLQFQLDRFNALFQFPTAFIPAGDRQR